jgi:hypothetical protein
MADVGVVMHRNERRKSSQGTQVSAELEVLRQKQLAKSQRNKLKDCTFVSVMLISTGNLIFDGSAFID